jgi:hypothetical protein
MYASGVASGLRRGFGNQLISLVSRSKQARTPKVSRAGEVVNQHLSSLSQIGGRGLCVRSTCVA